MKLNATDYIYKQITKHVKHIKDDGLSYFSIVQGEELAIVWDVGYGIGDIRLFIEELVETPYIVLLSHGHPDHFMGSFRFKEVYMPSEDIPNLAHYSSKEYRLKLLNALNMQQQKDEAIREKILNATLPSFLEIVPGMEYNLGGVKARLIDLGGHSKGALGLLVEEDKILLAGDSVNPTIWLFNIGADKLNVARRNLEFAKKEDFDMILGSHSSGVFPKELIQLHLDNIESMRFDSTTRHTYVGCETYRTVLERGGLRSEIVYDKRLI